MGGILFAIMQLTAIYAAQPAPLVKALDSTSRPLIPKSHSLTLPSESIKILEGFTSERESVSR